MTIEEHANKRTITEAELLSLTQEQMEEISKYEGNKDKAGKSLTYEQRLKISQSQRKRWFEIKNHLTGNV